MTRRAYYSQVVLWVGLYVVLALAPLAVSLIGHTGEYRGFWIEFGVGLGFVGLAMMGLQFVLTARFRTMAAPFGTDAMLQFHRQAGLAAYWFILGHVLILFVADPDYLSFLDPRVNAPRALALTTVIVALTLLLVATFWRKTLHISYEWWRLSHGLMAFLVVFIGLAHILMVGFYTSELWKQVLWVGLTGAAMGLLLHVRLVKPLHMLRRPYEIADVRQETESVWTLEIEPDGHDGLRFNAGQFVWLTIGPSPFSLQQHPFTIASSAEQSGRYELTIKELGDFTSTTLPSVPPGTQAYLEGPYGAFTLSPDASMGAVFVIGGIGITPVMSMLRTLKDRGDSRPLLLIYGNPSYEEIVFRDELEALESELNLEVVHVLENPPEEWDGETGRIDVPILRRHQLDVDEVEYLVCGPEPMMDGVEQTLRRWGLPLRRVKSERFNIV